MTALGHYRSAYDAALAQHVLRNDEATLNSGYELGRRAVTDGVSALDLASIHHDALKRSLEPDGLDNASEIIDAAATFLQEVLSAFEMIHRGYGEVTLQAAAERRNAVMLRQLSTFLADASLAWSDSEANAEVLRLVAEHARELTDAACCVATCSVAGRRLRATSPDDETEAGEQVGVLQQLEDVGDILPRRVRRSEWRSVPSLRGVATAVGVITVPIVALDGRRLGRLQLVDKKGGDFSDVDEAILVHLAGMTAASLERSELYRREHVIT